MALSRSGRVLPSTADSLTTDGLRATAVIRLKRAGLTTLMISNIVGMSLDMVEHYCRFEDKRVTGKAALVILAEHARKKKTETAS